MKLLSRQERRYPCGHSFASFGDAEPSGSLIKKCGTCRVRYEVTFTPASVHVHEMTRQTVYRTQWVEVA